MIPSIYIYGREDAFRNYGLALWAAGACPCFSLRPAEASVCDGLLLPGGGDLAPDLYGAEPCGSEDPDRGRDAAELELVNVFAAAEKPILGVCRGMQVLNVFFGGTLIQDLPCHRQVNGQDVLHSVRAAAGSPLAAWYGERFTVNSAHHQAVDRLGHGLHEICTADDGIVEAIAHATLPILGVQWHPERLTGALFRPDAADGAAVFRFFMPQVFPKVPKIS